MRTNLKGNSKIITMFHTDSLSISIVSSLNSSKIMGLSAVKCFSANF